MKICILCLLFFALASNLSAQSNSTTNEFANSVDPAMLKLAPVFVADDGGLVYLKETDKYVYWFAEHPGRGYSHVFRGTRNGYRIKGKMISVPKYAAKTVAHLTMDILPGGFLRQSGANKAPFTKLSPRKLSDVKHRLPLPAFPAFRANTKADFDGGYKDEKGRQFYVRTVGNQVVFFVESTFKEGKKPTAAYVYFGKWVGENRRFATGELVALSKGKRKLNGIFSLGFSDEGLLSGKSDFQYLKTVLAKPMTKPSSTIPTNSVETVFPSVPRWISFTNAPRVELDFGNMIDENPQLTLPIELLPKWLPLENGKLVIPNNFCGLHIRNVDSIYWQDGESVVVDYPYQNIIGDLSRVDSTAYMGGVYFDGPIGKCAGSNKGWRFFQPITQHGADSPLSGLKLVMEIDPSGDVHFVNYQIIAGKPLSPDKLFTEKTYKDFKDKVKKLLNLGNKEGYCEFDQYIEKICSKPDPEDQFPEAPMSVCPAGDDFESLDPPFDC